jgi:DNA-binding transcriptional ArsR family regulator
MNEDGDASADAIFELLANDCSRRILLAADLESRTAQDLEDLCDASISTVYRRIAMLKRHGLIEDRSTISLDGFHRKQFTTTLETLQVEVSDGELTLSVERADDPPHTLSSPGD